MSQHIGRYCSSSPGRGEERDRIYAQIQERWGSRLQRLPRIEKLQVLAALSLTLTYAEEDSDYDLSCAIDDLSFRPLGQAGDFLAMAAELPTSEYLDLCGTLISQLRGQK